MHKGLTGLEAEIPGCYVERSLLGLALKGFGIVFVLKEPLW
jgi:hypothetical protein